MEGFEDLEAAVKKVQDPRARLRVMLDQFKVVVDRGFVAGRPQDLADLANRIAANRDALVKLVFEKDSAPAAIQHPQPPKTGG